MVARASPSLERGSSHNPSASKNARSWLDYCPCNARVRLDSLVRFALNRRNPNE